PSSVSIHPRMY
ncbi:hypothetical protein BVRB_035890, partial [Beta vulgaris subsp. vulgaris]